MFVLGNLFRAIAEVLNIVLMLMMFVVAARAILSWVSPDPYNPIVRFIHNVTEPVLSWVRRRLPVVYGGMDWSPIVVFLAILFLREFLVNTLYRLGVVMQ